MVTPLEDIFPGLARGHYRITSASDPDYNCVAWAAGETARWWWPGADVEREYWPPTFIREATLAAFQAAFEALGYGVCQGAELESGFEKIALFADAQGVPTHAARQLPNGRWTSKLGKREDIEHALGDLTSTIYGSVAQIMRRARVAPAQEATAAE